MITPNINRSVPVIGVIKSIKKALKASMKDPFLYTEEEIHKLKKAKRDYEKIEQESRKGTKRWIWIIYLCMIAYKNRKMIGYHLY